MFENFSVQALNSFLLAHAEAKRYGLSRIGTEEILIGLIGEGGIACGLLRQHDITLSKARAALEHILDYDSKSEVEKSLTLISAVRNFFGSFVELDLSPGARRVLKYSAEKAQSSSSAKVETCHLLVALLEEKNCLAIQILESLQVDLQQLELELNKTAP